MRVEKPPQVYESPVDERRPGSHPAVGGDPGPVGQTGQLHPLEQVIPRRAAPRRVRPPGPSRLARQIAGAGRRVHPVAGLRVDRPAARGGPAGRRPAGRSRGPGGVTERSAGRGVRSVGRRSPAPGAASRPRREPCRLAGVHGVVRWPPRPATATHTANMAIRFFIRRPSSGRAGRQPGSEQDHATSSTAAARAATANTLGGVAGPSAVQAAPNAPRSRNAQRLAGLQQRDMPAGAQPWRAPAARRRDQHAVGRRVEQRRAGPGRRRAAAVPRGRGPRRAADRRRAGRRARPRKTASRPIRSASPPSGTASSRYTPVVPSGSSGNHCSPRSARSLQQPGRRTRR